MLEQAGKTLQLRYRSSDNSGQTSLEVDLVYQSTTLPYRFVPLSIKKTGSVPLRLPKSFRGRLQFCVQSLDPSANESPRSCAAVKITRPPKPKPRKHKPHR